MGFLLDFGILILINLVTLYMINRYFSNYRKEITMDKIQLIESSLRNGVSSFPVEKEDDVDSLIRHFSKDWKVEVVKEGRHRVLKFGDLEKRKLLKG